MSRNDLNKLDKPMTNASLSCAHYPEPKELAKRLRAENLSLGVTLGSAEDAPVFQFNDDRFLHTAVVGRTGSGKSNHVLQMEREDIRSGAGVAIIAAHEEDALYPLMCVPDERMDDVVIIDPTNTRMLPNMNPLDVDRKDRAAVSKAVSDCIELLKSQCRHEWAGPRFDQMARLGLETMLDAGFPTKPYKGLPCGPHIGLIERMFTDADYVKSFLSKLTDKHLYDQWILEAKTRKSSDADDKVQWFLSKLDPFCSDRVLKNVFGPGGKTIDVKRIVDEGKILVAFIPEHRIGHDAAHMLRTWLLMQLEDAILQRGANADGGYYGICAKKKSGPEPEPFFVYVDEFAEHATQGFASFLSESRKYRVGFTLAFQNLSQMRLFDVNTGYENNKLLDAVFGNVGTLICYPVGSPDVPLLARQLDVEERKVAAIKRYRPLARVCFDNEPALFTLDVPEKPAPDDTDMPELLAENQIINNIWLPVSGR